MRIKPVAAVLVLCAALVVGGAAAARNPTPNQKAALTLALQSQQGQVAVQSIAISSANPGYASMNWGFSNGGQSALNNSLFRLAGGQWKVLWTRESEQPADGACAYVPAQVAHDLLKVSCPAASILHARRATGSELALLRQGFLKSSVTPYAKNANGLAHACISKLSPSWAAAVANFPSGSTVYVWFQHTKSWRSVYESLMERGARPPAKVILSLASCVGYNPADYE